MPNQLLQKDRMPAKIEPKALTDAKDYIGILRQYDASPSRVEFHLQVGEVGQVQGWMLHVSIIRTEIEEAFHRLIPFLLSRRAAFRIVKDRETAISVLDGNLGQKYIGKIITIYPQSEEHAMQLAGPLIMLTQDLKGPSILTDIHIGGCLYTRYGSFSQIIHADDSGTENAFMYNRKGELVRDTVSIPFQIPEGVNWPFLDYASCILPKGKQILHDIYRPLENLKTDPRGNVIKAHYLHSLFRVKTCIIKQAKKHMWSDEYGRDMADRLLWQKQLHDQLHHKIRMPKVLDLFKDDEGNTYLAMEFIKAKSVFEYVSNNLNPNCECWELWTIGRQLEALDYLQKICALVQKLHKLEIVHRDVTPVNFLIDRNGELVMIDIELAYSISNKKPNPPFAFGTRGFMSPEQQEIKTPAIEEDIYGLGASIITVISGIPPIVFDTTNIFRLHDHLAFFYHDEKLVDIVIRCLSYKPTNRPSVSEISAVLKQYQEEIGSSDRRSTKLSTEINLQEQNLISLITDAIRGITAPPMPMNKGLWHFRIDQQDYLNGKATHSFGKAGGLFRGIAGVLYCLSNAKLAGFNISNCANTYEANWSYLRSTYLSELPNLPPGLAGGAAGISMAIARGIEAGLIEDNEQNKDMIKAGLSVPHYGLDLMSGIAGQGLAAMDCSPYLPDSFLSAILANYVDIILESQDKNGNWAMVRTGSKRPMPAMGFYLGNTGINQFLLSYYIQTKDSTVERSIYRALNSLQIMLPRIKKQLRRVGFRDLLQDVQLRDGYRGSIMNLVKAFEATKDRNYKQHAENLLDIYPSQIVHEDFTHEFGLSGLGCLYLDAYRVFKNEKWKNRSDWIVNFFNNTWHESEYGNKYWLINNQTLPTSDLMSGNAGILNFLLGYYTQNKNRTAFFNL